MPPLDGPIEAIGLVRYAALIFGKSVPAGRRQRRHRSALVRARRCIAKRVATPRWLFGTPSRVVVLSQSWRLVSSKKL